MVLNSPVLIVDTINDETNIVSKGRRTLADFLSADKKSSLVG